MLTKIKNKYYGFLAIIATQLFMLKSAFAQSIGFAAPPASDMSRQFIDQIFGGLVDGGLVDGGTDAFGGAIATFNGAALVVGGILVAYTVLAGTLGTAHDGEMLGKKFSSVWVPIRTALGTALVMPVLPGGYCVMQGLVMWLIMQGVSLGNMVWSSYTSTTPPSLVAPVSKGTREALYKFAEDVYLAHVCLEAKKAAAASSPPILNRIITSDRYAAEEGPSLHGRTIYFGNHGVNTESKASCGQIDLPKEPTTVVNTFATSPTGGKVSALSNLESNYRSVDLTGVRTAHVTNIRNMVNTLQPLAVSAIESNNTVTEQQVRQVADAYITALESAGASAAGAANGILSAANSQGWFLAGTWITRIITTKNKISSAVNTVPDYDITMKPIDSGSYADVYHTKLSNGFRVLSTSRPELLVDMTTSVDETTPATSRDVSAQDVSSGGKVGKWMAEFVTGIDLETIKTETNHPLIVMTSIGDQIFSSIMIGTAAAAGLGIVAGVAGKLVDFTPTFITIYGTFAFPLAAFIGVAGMLSYILPNLPFLIWLGIIIGWTIMVVEAVLAAPLWAVMHLHPNGDDMTGKGGSGYMLVLGLLLRPALIVFGLISAIIFSDLFGQLLNKVFFEVFSGSITSGGLGFFTMIFGTAIYATAMFMIIKNTFALMHIIPDQLMRWIGGGGEQLGQYANQVSDGAAMKAGAAAGAGIGYMAKDTLQGAGQGYGQMKQLQEAKRNTAAQQDSNRMQQETGYADADKTTGAGSGDISRAIDKEMSGSPLKSAQAKSDFAVKSEMLGGANSENALQYRQSLLENLNQGIPYDQASQASFSKAYDSKYGSGAYTVADTIAKGDSNNGANTGMYNLAMQRTSTLMDNKLDKIAESGAEDPKTEMSRMFKNAVEITQRNPEISMKSAIKQASENINTQQQQFDFGDDNNKK